MPIVRIHGLMQVMKTIDEAASWRELSTRKTKGVFKMCHISIRKPYSAFTSESFIKKALNQTEKDTSDIFCPGAADAASPREIKQVRIWDHSASAVN